MSFKGLFLSWFVFSTTLYVYAVDWKPLKMNTDLVQNGEIEITGFLNGRRVPSDPKAVPEFRGAQSLYKVIPPGTLGKVLEVKKNIFNGRTEYAVKIKLSAIGIPNVGDYQPENYPKSDQEMWVYVDPTRPYVKYLSENEEFSFKDFAENKLTQGASSAPLINPVDQAAEDSETNEILPTTQSAGSSSAAPFVAAPNAPKPPAAPVKPPTPTPPVAPVTVSPPSSAQANSTTNLSNSKMCKVPVTPEDKTSANCQPGSCVNSRNQKRKDIFAMDRKYGAGYATRILSIVQQAAAESGVNPAILMAKMDEESSFDRNAHSPTNDHGIAQFQFGTGAATLKYWKSIASGNSPVRNLTSANLSAVRGRTNCGTAAHLVPDLYCPEFAIRLMAFHIKQTLAKVPTSSIRTMLVNDDPVAQMRYIASVYNRGDRIIKSAEAYKRQTGRNISARDYGVLWNTNANGGLKGQNINRCYVYRIAGLCGGLGNSVIGQYTTLYCNSSNSIYKIPSAGVQ